MLGAGKDDNNEGCLLRLSQGMEGAVRGIGR